MRIASPLRYPGGKAALADVLCQIRRLNGLGRMALAEPFAGGAGAALTLLFAEETTEIFINDADPAIHALWWSLVHRSQQFACMLASVDLSMTEWRRQRDIYKRRSGVSRLSRGFSAFYLNRCNRSGVIIDGGPIGGVQQTGEWKLDARFNKVELRRRCEKVGEFRKRISTSCVDGIEFIARTDPKSTFFFIDPPYFVKGQTLYMNSLDADYHRSLASKLKSMTGDAWVLTYDDCPEIRRLYRGWAAVRSFGLRYAAAERRNGKEILIAPKWMRLPKTQTSGAVTWS